MKAWWKIIILLSQYFHNKAPTLLLCNFMQILQNCYLGNILNLHISLITFFIHHSIGYNWNKTNSHISLKIGVYVRFHTKLLFKVILNSGFCKTYSDLSLKNSLLTENMYSISVYVSRPINGNWVNIETPLKVPLNWILFHCMWKYSLPWIMIYTGCSNFQSIVNCTFINLCLVILCIYNL